MSVLGSLCSNRDHSLAEVSVGIENIGKGEPRWVREKGSRMSL